MVRETGNTTNNVVANNNVDDILRPDGKAVGAKGTSSGIRTVSSSELDDIEKYLMNLGSEKMPKDLSYPNGTWYKLPNGQGRFGIRNSKDFGKTIDINVPSIPSVKKIHIKK